MTDQIPMGCYWEFAHAPNLVTRLSDDQMPFARRTTDRMWVAAPNTQSAGQKLQAHLQTSLGITLPNPGTSSACIDSFGTPIVGQTAVSITRNTWVSLGSTCSRYLEGQRWTLTTPAGSAAALIGADTATPQFLPDKQGNYTITLADASGTPSTSVVASVPVSVPVAGSGSSSVVLDGTGNASVDIDVMQLAGSQSRDPLSSIAILGATGVTASVTSTTATSATLHINVSSLAGGTVTYQLTDIDGDQSGVGTITINVSASIVANNATINVNTNGSGSINLGNLVSAASQPYTLTIQSQPTINRGRGTGSVTAPSGGSVIYTAPLGVTSHIGSTLISAASIDSFVYRACFVSQPSACSNGTVTVQLIGSATSTSVIAQMGSICSACHSSTPPVGGTVGQANPNYIISVITNNVTLAPYDTVDGAQGVLLHVDDEYTVE